MEYCVSCGQKIAVANIEDVDSACSENKSSTNPALAIIALLLVVANVVIGVMNFTKSSGNGQFVGGSPQQETTSNSATNASTTDKKSTTTTNKESGKQESADNVITGEYTYTGTIKVDGLSCFLELEKNIRFQDPNDTNPIETNRLWLSESDIKVFRGYNGLTVTLKGDLFNYRGGGTLMFNGTPTIVSVTGTPDIITDSSTYTNWDSTDNKTKFWDAIEVLKTVIYECEGVWNVRVLCDEDVLNRVEKDGFSSFDMVTLSINDSWISEYGYEIYITPNKDYVCIALGPIESPNIPLFTYSWDGEFISGEISLQEYITNNGLI